jgi:hypothetical protein
MKQDIQYLPVQKALQGILATIVFPCAVHAELLSAEDRCLIFSQNSNLPFGAASVIKLPLLVLPGSVALAGKTGGMPGSLLDAELVSVANGPTYSLCVFASGFDRAVQAKRLMAQVSERVYEAVSGGRSADCI